MQARNQKKFQGSGVFVKIGHLSKHFLKNTRKEHPTGKIFVFFLLDTLKTTFWTENLTQRRTQSGPLFPNSGHFFLFSKKGRGGLLLLPPNCAPAMPDTPDMVIINASLALLTETKLKRAKHMKINWRVNGKELDANLNIYTFFFFHNQVLPYRFCIHQIICTLWIKLPLQTYTISHIST